MDNDSDHPEGMSQMSMSQEGECKMDQNGSSKGKDDDELPFDFELPILRHSMTSRKRFFWNGALIPVELQDRLGPEPKSDFALIEELLEEEHGSLEGTEVPLGVDLA